MCNNQTIGSQTLQPASAGEVANRTVTKGVQGGKALPTKFFALLEKYVRHS